MFSVLDITEKDEKILYWAVNIQPQLPQQDLRRTNLDSPSAPSCRLCCCLLLQGKTKRRELEKKRLPSTALECRDRPWSWGSRPPAGAAKDATRTGKGSWETWLELWKI